LFQNVLKRPEVRAKIYTKWECFSLSENKASRSIVLTAVKQWAPALKGHVVDMKFQEFCCVQR